MNTDFKDFLTQSVKGGSGLLPILVWTPSNPGALYRSPERGADVSRRVRVAMMGAFSRHGLTFPQGCYKAGLCPLETLDEFWFGGGDQDNFRYLVGAFEIATGEQFMGM